MPSLQCWWSHGWFLLFPFMLSVLLLDSYMVFVCRLILPSVSCRFRCPGPGMFQCSLTGLVFVVDQEAELLYSTVQWDESLLQSAGKMAAGPLFNIHCPEDAVCELHLPHCEAEDALPSEGLLSVVHITDDGMSFLKPLEITHSHVIVKVSHLSAFGLVWLGEMLQRLLNNKKPICGQLLLFLRPPARDIQILDVFLMPSNLPLSEVAAQQDDAVYIKISSDCKLIVDQRYSVLSDLEDFKIQPEVSQTSIRLIINNSCFALIFIKYLLC
uniref:FIIND domain-containing protein n=1 Tax=Echeneis naucrates TaxID=173247 RepID=A0A665SV75_ECHNA